jgi:hypothetical protein
MPFVVRRETMLDHPMQVATRIPGKDLKLYPNLEGSIEKQFW